MFKLSLAFSASTLVAGAAVTDLAAYCNSLATKCTGAGFVPSNCTGAFANFDLGDDTEVDVNTIGCRQKFLIAANFNATTDCRYAGPSGGGRCGAVLDSTCKMATTVCDSVFNASYVGESACLTGLIDIQHQWGSLQGTAAGGDNSLECRLYHAYTGQVDGIHCSHFGLGGGPCGGRVVPNAAHYCDLLEYNCGSALQFGSKAQCLAVAAGYPSDAKSDSGSNGLNSANSLGCREYHSQAALSSLSHCAHAGPSGGNGICGSAQEAWGSILAAAPCLDPHVNLFLSAFSDPAAVDALIPYGPSAPYTTTLDQGGNTQVCRIYHLGVAGVDPVNHCAHGSVSGGAGCGSRIANLCQFIGTACSFGPNSTWQFASENDCVTNLTGIAAGTTKPVDTTNNTVECRFYHATVAATYAPGGVAELAPGALETHRFHCGHVLKPSNANGCGWVPPPTSAAPSAAPNTAAPSAAAPTSTTANSASALSLVASVFAVVGSVFSF